MVTRKKRITILVSCVIVLVLLLAVAFIFLYLNTDMFKSKETLFLKYIGNNSENLKQIGKIIGPDEFAQKLEVSPYKQNSKIKVNYTKNYGTTSEDMSNSINTLELTIDGQTDKNNQYDNQTIKLVQDETEKLNLEYIQKEGLCGVKFLDLFRQYLLVENSDLKNFFQKIGYNEEQVEYIPDSIQIQPNILNQIYFSEEEIESLKEKYINLMYTNIENRNFEKQSNGIIDINGTKIVANSYILNLTKEQLNNLYIKLLENLQQDEIILSKIESIPGITSEQWNATIEKTIQEINSNNIGNEETKIIVYESEGETVRTTLQGVDYTINIDFLFMPEEQFMEFNYTKSEEEIYKMTFTNNNEQCLFSFNNNLKSSTITVKQNKKTTDNQRNVNTILEYEDGINKIEADITQQIQLMAQLQQVVEFNNENSIQLDTLQQEQFDTIITRVKDGVNGKWEMLKEEINEEDIQEVLKVVGIIKDTSRLEETGEISEIEKNRYNSQYELLQAEEVNAKEVVEVINTIQSNLINMEVVSNKELKLQIDENENNPEIVEKLKTFLEQNQNRAYSIKVEYNEKGLVQDLLLTILEPNN